MAVFEPDRAEPTTAVMFPLRKATISSVRSMMLPGALIWPVSVAANEPSAIVGYVPAPRPPMSGSMNSVPNAFASSPGSAKRPAASVAQSIAPASVA